MITAIPPGMGTVDRPSTHREELGLVVDIAGNRFTAVAVLVTVGLPLGAFLTGLPSILFYVHVALGAFWFGVDFFFKFVIGPVLEASPEDSANDLLYRLGPKSTVLLEPLSVGVIGSGIGLAYLMGYWANPTMWLWGALGIGILMLMIGLGPLHFIVTDMSVELTMTEPDTDRLDQLLGRSFQWGLIQTILMLAIIAMMVGVRGLLPL